MKKRSILWCIFHHPLKILVRSAVCFLVIAVLCSFGDNQEFYTSGTFLAIILAISLLIGVFRVQKLSNDELRRQQYGAPYTPQPASAPTKRKKKSLLFGAMRSMNNSMNQGLNNFASGLGSAMMGSGSSGAGMSDRQRRQQADQAAWDRWHAQDMQKKAEWDARDAALRGKDKAAWQRKNDADYWYRQSRK